MEAIVVHGGAWNMPKKLERPHLKGVKEACKVGRDSLIDKKDSVEAVVNSLLTMEDDETFDAGVGSFLNAIGQVELDAGIMEGDTMNYGCCGDVSMVRNPILLCKKILENEPNKLLVCDGAHRFALDNGIPLINNKELIIPRELERYNKRASSIEKYFSPSDTVGAVAIDPDQKITAANTTGGTPGKIPGRIGDSPIVGCGIYAGKEAGIAATGLGEPIIKTVLSKRVYDLCTIYGDLREAAEKGIQELTKHGWGGVIALDKNGTVVASHNTEKMPHAYWNENDDKIIVKISNK